MQYTPVRLWTTALVMGLLGAVAVEASGAYDAIVIKGPSLNAASSYSVARILGNRLGWSVGVLELGDLGRYNFDGVKLIYFPGADYLRLRLPHNAKENIRHAVSRGTGWIGTCGGSLVASYRSPQGETIGLFPGRQKFGGIRGNRTFVFDVKHPIVANSSAADRITPELEMHNRGGPSDYILNRYFEPGIKNWVIARHKGGKRRPAVVAVLFGKGRVLLTTSHPERPEYMPPEIAKAPQVIEMAAEWCAGLSDPSTKRPPTVKLEAPDRGEPGRKLDLSAIGSEDPDQYPLGFIWDFGDGSPQDFTPVARHAFAEPGRYTVTLKVTDGKRHTVHQSQVTIAGEAGDSPPTVTFLSPFQENHLHGKVEIAIRAFDRDEGVADGDGIEEVLLELLSNDKIVLAKTLKTAPYIWNADLASVPDGSYRLRATVEEISTSIPVVVANEKALAKPLVNAGSTKPATKPAAAE